MNVLKILHLEDNSKDAEFVRSVLEEDHLDCKIDRVSTKGDFEQAFQRNSYDIILSDFSMPGFDGLKALMLAQQLKPEIPFIFLSGTIGEERAVESLKNGAVDYVLKDRVQRLSNAILRARKEALERIERCRNDLQIRQQAELLNQAQDAIYVRDLDQNITYWNKAAERIYGWASNEVIGKRASDLLYTGNGARRDYIWKAILEKGEWTGELAQITKNGKEICVSSRRTLLKDLNGTPLAILNINTDITEKKSLEVQVLRSQRLDSIGALAGGIAHDLNNVLAPIVMASGLLQGQLRSPEDLRMVDIVKSSANKGTELVKQILQFASGTKPWEAELNLKSILGDVAKLALKTFPRTISVETDIQDDLLPVSGDRTQLHQILLNLCVNARDAMPDGGRLTIRIKNTVFSDRIIYGRTIPISGSFVELAVSDTGTGIHPDVLDRIFEPFFTTKTRDKGTGLGLSTVTTIVRNHRGYLDIDTAVGKGTTFRVFLPLSNQTIPNESEVSPNGAPCGRGEWILVVDDEFALLEMTRELLEAHDYHVITARTGSEALACFEAHHEKIAVVITDFLMPGLESEGWITNLCERFPKAMTICLSGSANGNALHGSGKAPRAFLRKPCSTTDLLGTLHRLLAAPAV